MSDLGKLTKLIIKFRDARNWKQFHNPKDIALSLVLEATEVMEHFQWKNEEEIEKYIKTNRDKIGEELADVFYWTLLMSHDLKIDLKDALERKMVVSKKKYPVEKAKGTHKKYTEL
jgi:NTP pyrophosphatase (non-canonical NTP hydrolase)